MPTDTPSPKNPGVFEFDFNDFFSSSSQYPDYGNPGKGGYTQTDVEGG